MLFVFGSVTRGFLFHAFVLLVSPSEPMIMIITIITMIITMIIYYNHSKHNCSIVKTNVLYNIITTHLYDKEVAFLQQKKTST